MMNERTNKQTNTWFPVTQRLNNRREGGGLESLGIEAARIANRRLNKEGTTFNIQLH